MSLELNINGIEITTDGENRYSLNDLHKASGGLNKHKPSLFYRSHSFNDVVEILKAQNRAFEPIVKKTRSIYWRHMDLQRASIQICNVGEC